ncbi:MAG: acyltransferase [Planctomycetes bacterium]|nr:acyltransferase [Planctomycetota bacterium]
MDSKGKSLTFVPSLDGLRGVACLFVLFFHAGFKWAKGGFIGVDIFFVLSGFLITSILLKELESKSKIDIKRFFFNRALRLLPVLYVTVFGYLLLVLISAENSISRWYATGEAMNCVLFLSNLPWRMPGYNTLFSHSWSLSVEWQFYLIWPFLLILIYKLPSFFMRIICVCLLMMVFPLLRIYNPSFLPMRMEGLLLGCFMALLLRRDPKALRMTTATSLPALFCVLLLLYVVHHVHISHPPFHVNGYILVSLCSFVIIASLLSEGPSLLKRLFEFPFFCFIGKISYGLYLIHYPIFRMMKYKFSYETIMLVGGGVSILLATLSYYLMEKPLLSKYKR